MSTHDGWRIMPADSDCSGFGGPNGVDVPECAECQWKNMLIASQAAQIAVLNAQVASLTAPTFGTPEWAVWKCPCSPMNGGSGVCNCVLGNPLIT